MQAWNSEEFSIRFRNSLFQTTNQSPIHTEPLGTKWAQRSQKGGTICIICMDMVSVKYILPLYILMRKDRLGIDESILSRFRADEVNSVLQIMELIYKTGSVNNAEVRNVTNKSKPTITRLLAKMRENGLVVSEGSGPAVRYCKSAQIS